MHATKCGYVGIAWQQIDNYMQAVHEDWQDKYQVVLCASILEGRQVGTVPKEQTKKNLKLACDS